LDIFGEVGETDGEDGVSFGEGRSSENIHPMGTNGRYNMVDRVGYFRRNFLKNLGRNVCV
jgi:hypothetical protein